MKIELFGHPLNPRPLGPPPWMQERQILFRIALTRALYDRMAPQLCLFYVPGQPSKTVKRSVRKKTWSGAEEITTGKTGNTLCLRSGHRINWFLTLQTLPVFPVVIIRQLSRDKGQKAGPQMLSDQTGRT